MRSALTVSLLLCLSSLGSLRAADPKPAAPLDRLGWIIGDWTIDTNWIGGPPLKARANYEWMLGGKFLAATTFVDDGKGGEYQRYFSIFGLQDGVLTQWAFAFDGSAKITTATTDDRTMTIEWSNRSADGTEVKLKQQVSPIDADSFGWKVWVDQKGEWKPMMDGVWKRKKQ